MSVDGAEKEPCDSGCEELQAYLCSLLDEEITPARAAELTRRIAQCPACHTRLRSEREIRALVKKCCSADTAPVTLRERITMQIRITRTR